MTWKYNQSEMRLFRFVGCAMFGGLGAASVALLVFVATQSQWSILVVLGGALAVVAGLTVGQWNHFRARRRTEGR